MLEQIHEINVNGKFYELDLTGVVAHMHSPDGSDYLLLVDNDGKLYTRKAVEDTVEPFDAPTTAGAIVGFGPKNDQTKLYINSLYCGGEHDENSLNYCSHNFVELSNLTTVDINLEGMTLQYAIDGLDWKVLPLHGVIKSGGTFLIRGKQCSRLDSPTTRIKVENYDMEWLLDGVPIAFEDTVSAKFYLCFNTAKCSVESPYDTGTSAVTSTVVGYIDLVGFKGSAGHSSGGFEGAGSEITNLSGTKLYRKYYAMDNVSQATKAIDARKNSADWCFVDLTKDDGDLIPSIEIYTPRASFEGKDLFYNKTGLNKDKPSMITCTFGIQATDSGQGATRCFNWLVGSAGLGNIWIRTKGAESWGSPNKAFEEGDGRIHHTDFWYNTKRAAYTNNKVLIAHKFIISGLTAGTYEYVAGKKNSDGTPDLEHCTEVREFTVRLSSSVDSFDFVQTSDQQGFNWEEYQLWKVASKLIMTEYPTVQFMMNTGDMTQNGNRVSEWLDYFNAECKEMKNLEEMATIGNNDLSPLNLEELGDGSDSAKLSLENIMFFYTFENDDDNKPYFEINGRNYYVPSLYSFVYGNVYFVSLTTEIKANLETKSEGYGFANYGNFYPLIKQWFETDFAKHGHSDGTGWNIGYCHEMPFTILTRSVTNNPTGKRTGSSANTNTPADMEFWLSEFFQTHNFPLVLGGHKHTQATTWPLLENVKYENGVRTVDSMHPIITITTADLASFNNSTKLVDYNGYKYPDGWFVKDGDNYTPSSTYTKHLNLCTFKIKEAGDTPVVYAMSQATAYKHTSNKELPSSELPWQRYYYPSGINATTGKDKADGGQLFPFFTVWHFTPNTITGDVRKVYGVFNGSGKFDINAEWPFVKEGYSAVEKDWSTRIHSINGITKMSNAAAETSTTKTIITK